VSIKIGSYGVDINRKLWFWYKSKVVVSIQIDSCGGDRNRHFWRQQKSPYQSIWTPGHVDPPRSVPWAGLGRSIWCRAPGEALFSTNEPAMTSDSRRSDCCQTAGGCAIWTCPRTCPFPVTSGCCCSVSWNKIPRFGTALKPSSHSCYKAHGNTN
jgi:hypothetical protein